MLEIQILPVLIMLIQSTYYYCSQSKGSIKQKSVVTVSIIHKVLLVIITIQQYVVIFITNKLAIHRSIIQT